MEWADEDCHDAGKSHAHWRRGGGRQRHCCFKRCCQHGGGRTSGERFEHGQAKARVQIGLQADRAREREAGSGWLGDRESKTDGEDVLTLLVQQARPRI